MEDLPTSIREVRHALKMRQADLAEVLKVKRNTISQYETGDATPSAMVLIRLYNIAPLGTLKDGLRKRLVSDFRSDYPEHPDLAEGVIRELATADEVEGRFPPTKNRRLSEQRARFSALVGRIGEKPMLDESITDILDDWFLFGDSKTVNVFRDAAEFVRTRMEILTGVAPGEAHPDEIMREAAKKARRLAIALLHQADRAEQKAREVRAPPSRKRAP